ncbi:hypothetical protein KHU50_008891 [Colletotrichum sp. SAR 10_65]|nr:hypothetical protein KHU50_008891 [Colletotrichum sp. SAR 10_65]KAI8211520.1 hypothetical protein K4K52_010225 [Colletotrichum sp. SAR 10_76]
MQISHFTIFAVLAGLGLAAPTAKVDSRAAQEVDPLMAAGKLLPRQITIEWCTKSCDCDKIPKEDKFQCYSNANCEECRRQGLYPPKKDSRV